MNTYVTICKIDASPLHFFHLLFDVFFGRKFLCISPLKKPICCSGFSPCNHNNLTVGEVNPPNVFSKYIAIYEMLDLIGDFAYFPCLACQQFSVQCNEFLETDNHFQSKIDVCSWE